MRSNENMPQSRPRHKSRCYRSSQLHRYPLLNTIIERVDLVYNSVGDALVEGDFASLESRGRSVIGMTVIVLGDGGYRGCGIHCNYPFCCHSVRGPSVRTKFYAVEAKYCGRAALDVVKSRISVKAQVMSKVPSVGQMSEKSASMLTRLIY